jgi:hypothetical protein
LQCEIIGKGVRTGWFPTSQEAIREAYRLGGIKYTDSITGSTILGINHIDCNNVKVKLFGELIVRHLSTQMEYCPPQHFKAYQQLASFLFEKTQHPLALQLSQLSSRWFLKKERVEEVCALFKEEFALSPTSPLHTLLGKGEHEFLLDKKEEWLLTPLKGTALDLAIFGDPITYKWPAGELFELISWFSTECQGVGILPYFIYSQPSVMTVYEFCAKLSKSEQPTSEYYKSRMAAFSFEDQELLSTFTPSTQMYLMTGLPHSDMILRIWNHICVHYRL